MILAHFIVGAMPVKNQSFHLFWFLGSVFPDIDHLFLFFRYKFSSLGKFIDSIRFEDKYGIHYKTKYVHSIFGSLVFSIPVYLFDNQAGTYFFLAYLLHLVLDWPDRDVKEYFYPSKWRVKGFLSIFSKTEIVFTIILFLVFIASSLLL